MKLHRELFAGTFNYGLSKFIPQLIGFLLIPLYTNVLEPEDYGLLEYCSVITATVMIFMRLGLTGSIFRFYYDHKSDHGMMNDYITTMHRLIMATSILTGLIFLFLGYFFIERLIVGMKFWPLFALIIITIAFNSNAEMQKRIIQAKKQSLYMLKLNIVFSLLSIFIVIVLVAIFKMGVVGYLIASLVVAIIFYFQAQYYLRPFLSGKFNWSMARTGFEYGIKVLPSHVVTPATQLVSRVLLGTVASISSVGIFALANRFLSPLNVISSSFQTAYNPVYFEFRSDPSPDHKLELEKLMKSTLSLAILIYLVVSVSGPVFIMLFTPERYHESASYIAWISIYFILGSVNVFYSAELYYSNVRFVGAIALARMATNLFLSFLLIYYFDMGTVGLIFAIMGEGLVNVMMTVMAVRKKIPIRFPLRRYFYLTALIVLLVLGGGYWLNSIIPNPVINLLIILILGFLLIFSFSPEIVTTLFTLYRKYFKTHAEQ